MGSNDGQQWEPLHEVDNTAFVARGQRVRCDIDETAAYSHFRLVLHGKANQTSFYLSEWQLIGHSVSATDITADGGTLDSCPSLTDHQGLTSVVLPQSGVVYRAAGNYVLSHYSLTTGADAAPQA